MAKNTLLSCPEWALRIYDGLALVTLAASVLAIVTGGGDDGAAAPEAGREWSDLALAAFLPVVLAATIWLGRRRGWRDADEFLMRLIGHAAMTGVMVTVMAWSSWLILAPGWVAPPTADQLVGVLLGSSAIGYGLARLRAAA